MENIYSIYGLADPVSSCMHLIAAVVFSYLSYFVLYHHGKNISRFISLFVFGFSAVLLLSMSGIYHLLPPGEWRFLFQRLDHAAIFMLIAGTFTAVHGILFKGFWRWGILLIVWSAAITGSVFKVFYFDDIPKLLSLTAYFSLGWLGLLTGIMLCKKHGFCFIKPLLYGGIAYSLGAVLDFLQQPILIPGIIGSHEIFHVAVLFGIGYHWQFVAKALDYARK